MSIKGSGEIKDVEYDEFKQYETTKDIIDLRSEMKEPQPQLTPTDTTEKPKEQEGGMLLLDMNIDQLRTAVVNLMNKNYAIETKLKDYENRAVRINAIWQNPKKIKERLRFLRNKGG
jgi:hypothetical protein